MPSWELFRALPPGQRLTIIPRHRPSLSIEAGATQGWLEFVDRAIGLDHFGASAPAATLYEEFGLTAAKLSAEALTMVGSTVSSATPTASPKS